MRLDGAQIRNFRSIEKLDFNFQPRCRVLVGINESGKSNILRALALLDEKAKSSADDIRETKPDEPPVAEAYVRFVFKLEARDRAKVVKGLEERVEGDVVNKPIIQIGGARLSLSQFVETQTETLYQVDLLQPRRRFTSWRLPADAIVLDPWRWCQRNVPPTQPGKPVTVATILADPTQDDYSGDKLVEITAESLNSVVAAKFHDILTEQMPEVLLWRYREEHLLPGKIVVATFSEEPDSCLPLKHMFNLAGIKDISEEMDRATERKNGLRNLLNKVGKTATRHLHSVWKEYKGIEFELVQNGDHIDAHILDRYNAYDLSRRSDGFKRFVSFLLHISAKAKSKELVNTLYLDDEPDTGLHPSGARYLRDELVKVSKENYVVYATHSIFMVDGDNLERHLIVSKVSEVTTVEQASDSNFANEEVLFNALGYSIFEQLKKLNLVFEGWRDKRLFQVALTSTTADFRPSRDVLRDAGQCHAKGVKDIGRVAAMLELAKRRCLIISDCDAPAKEQQRSFKSYGRWLRYDQVMPSCSAITGEDFLQWAVLKSALDILAAEDVRLTTLPNESEFTRGGTLQVAKAWLKTSGVPEEEIKKRLDYLKELLFTDLRISHISLRYFEFLTALAVEVQNETLVSDSENA